MLGNKAPNVAHFAISDLWKTNYKKLNDSV